VGVGAAYLVVMFAAMPSLLQANCVVAYPNKPQYTVQATDTLNDLMLQFGATPEQLAANLTVVSGAPLLRASVALNATVLTGSVPAPVSGRVTLLAVASLMQTDVVDLVLANAGVHLFTGTMTINSNTIQVSASDTPSTLAAKFSLDPTAPVTAL